MSNATIATNFDKSLDVKSCIPAKVTLNSKMIGDIVAELFNIVFRQISATSVRINTCCFDNFFRSSKTDTVNIGAIVSVVNLNNGKEFEYTMVGVTESNPLKGKISDRSPIGKALMGRRTGDDVPVETPAGPITLKIVSIRK